MYKIYIVEDELDLAKLLESYLKKEGYEPKIFTTGEEAIAHVGDEVHLWILDIMLKDDISGYDVIKAIRDKDGMIPVIFTSARDKDIDKILGLEMGGDDYLVKPYSMKELVLRVNRSINRTYFKDLNKMIYNDYLVNLNQRSVVKDDISIKLTTIEFNLLELLLLNQNITLSRDAILEKVWGQDYFGSDRAVDDLVRRLRKKMPELNLETIYGYGYRLL
jgi:two-component system response regulator CssR